MQSFQAIVAVFNMGMIGILTALVRRRFLFLTFKFLRSPYWKWIGLTYTTNKIPLKWWSVTLESAIKDMAASALEVCFLLDQSV